MRSRIHIDFSMAFFRNMNGMACRRGFGDFGATFYRVWGPFLESDLAIKASFDIEGGHSVAT